jgi:hypothetical protein
MTSEGARKILKPLDVTRQQAGEGSCGSHGLQKTDLFGDLGYLAYCSSFLLNSNAAIARSGYLEAIRQIYPNQRTSGASSSGTKFPKVVGVIYDNLRVRLAGRQGHLFDILASTFYASVDC